MTKTDTALANLEAAQNVFSPAADEARFSRFALSKSKTKANRARYAAACDAFDAALAICDEAHAALGVAEDADATAAEHAAALAEAALQPSFF